MRIALVQTDITWGDVGANHAHLQEAMTATADEARPNLFVLPEMFSTGFATTGEELAEDEPAASLSWMKKMAAQLNAAICGSIALKLESGRCVNRMYFVRPDGSHVHYDKKHLFGYGGECKHFSAGDERVIVEYGGIRFMLAVCYDLRFPVWLRNRKDYDALIIVASWPKPRRKAWDVLCQARAIENQSYVLSVNRVGCDPSCEYNGGSALIGPKGDILGTAEDGAECVIVAEISASEAETFRSEFPALEDADAFSL